MKRKYILALLLGFFFLTIKAETINGPANIRIEPNKKILFSLNDGVDVDCTELKNDWFKIGIQVRITSEQYEKNLQLKKGEKLITLEGKVIGEVLLDLPASSGYSWTYGGAPDNPQIYGMTIFGFTHKSNIYKNSIPENPLLDLIEKNKNNLNLDNFKGFISSFHFTKAGLLKEIYPSLTEYMIDENIIDDPSPMDRIRLIFENETLIAIIHTRPLNFKYATDSELVRNRKIILFKTPKGVDKMTFIQKNIDSYNGVD